MQVTEKEYNTETTTSAAKPAQGAHSSVSKGEKLFDWATYGGIAGIGVFLGTIPIGYWAKYGKGADLFHRAGQALVKNGSSPENAEQILMTTTLMQGGNIALIPIKCLEDNKPEIVQRLNEMLGEKTDIEHLESEPKQTWSSIIKGRLLAWTAVYVSFKAAFAALGPEKFSEFENKFAENVVCKPMGKPPHINGQETKLFRYGKIGALDLFATAGAATLLYLGSRFFAKGNPTLTVSNKPSSPPESAINSPAHPVADDRAADQQHTQSHPEITLRAEAITDSNIDDKNSHQQSDHRSSLEPASASSIADKITAQRQKDAETLTHMNL